MGNKLREIANSHNFDCGAVDASGDWVFDSENTEEVVLLVYRDGMTWPLCRCYDTETSKCKAEEDEENRGLCIYSVGPREAPTF